MCLSFQLHRKEEFHPGWPGNRLKTPFKKIPKAELAEGLASVIEYLPSKHKALYSNPNTEKKNSF
jgi:hypothetical protein